jgi:hypothetical protein
VVAKVRCSCQAKGIAPECQDSWEPCAVPLRRRGQLLGTARQVARQRLTRYRSRSVWVGTWTLQSGTGGPPSDPSRTAAPLSRTWRTSAVGDVALDSMNGCFQGLCGGPKNASCRGGPELGRVDLRYGYLVSRITSP